MKHASASQRIIAIITMAAWLALPFAPHNFAAVYDFAADGQEYSGDILGKNPLFVPGGLRTLPEFNDLYQTSNGFIDDEFKAGSGNPVDFRMTNGSFTNWENGSPTIASWINARDGFKFPAGTRLGGDFSGSLTAGEIITFRAFEFPIGSGLHTEMNQLSVVDEVSMTVETDSSSVPFLFESLSGDARSFAAHRTTAEGEYIISPIGMSTNMIELTTVADTNPPEFPHSPTQFDFGNVGKTYQIDAFELDDSGPEALEKVNAALDSSHGFHDEEFEIRKPEGEGTGGFSVGGGATNGYPDRWLNMGGTLDHVNFWVNAKEGHMFPQDAAIGVTRFNPGWTQFDNNGQPVEVIIRAYAERIETGSFDEISSLTLVGEAIGEGVGTFNTPPALELMNNARSFTVQTGDGNGNFTNFFQEEDVLANIALNQIIVDTVPEPDLGLAGDFDGDGDVDGSDFLAWQRGESPNPNSASDLSDWEANFGTLSTFVTTQAVPEPNAGAMLLLLLAGGSLTKRWFP